eukprot:6859400-Prymnesium_polylepis.1
MIGSGIGSLYCAGLLARAGFKVVVLEQHYVAGGCTHSFEDHGYEFDTGLHYVGRIEKYKVLLDLVSAKGKEVEWAKMGTEADGFTYDKVVIGKEKPHLFRAGADKFVEDLAARFPADRDGIEAYSKCASKATHTLAHTLARAPRSERAIRAGDPRGPCQTIGVAGVCANKVNKSADLYFYGKLFHPLIQWLINTFLCSKYFEYSRRTAMDVVSELVSDPQLRSLLCGQFGNYGLPPDKASFMIQAGIAAHYMGGGYYPIGGPQTISQAIIPTIEAAGGRVLVKATVTSILIESGRACGVSLRDDVE